MEYIIIMFVIIGFGILTKYQLLDINVVYQEIIKENANVDVEKKMTKEFDKELENLLGKEATKELKCKDCGSDLVLCPKCGEAICIMCM